MKNLIKRNIKIFFRQKSNIFFSVLGIGIMFIIFTVFLGDQLTKSMNFPSAKLILNLWLISGLIGTVAFTSSLCAYSIFVHDKDLKNYKDFGSSPIKKSSLSLSYLLSGYIIGILLSILTLLFGQIYLYITLKYIFSLILVIKMLLLISFITLATNAVVCFLMTFVNKLTVYSIICSLLGTIYGFITGAFACLGNFPHYIQTFIKVFPLSHTVMLSRYIMIEPELNKISSPKEVAKLQEILGINYFINGKSLPIWYSIILLIIVIIVFYILSVWRLKQKNK